MLPDQHIESTIDLWLYFTPDLPLDLVRPTISPLHLPYICPISPLHLPYISADQVVSIALCATLVLFVVIVNWFFIRREP